MRTEPLGDSALILRELDAPAYRFAQAIQEALLPGVLEAVASYDTVGVYFDPERFDPASLRDIHVIKSSGRPQTHEIPVCYEMGEDLTEVAEKLGVSAKQVVRSHTSQSYTCFAVGFCPGFPYLGYLPEAISGIPRRSAPRVRIEPGSVAITGRQTGVYPLDRPGGWTIIGRTPLCIVDVEAAYFPISAGDEVRFVAIDVEEFGRRQGERL